MEEPTRRLNRTQREFGTTLRSGTELPSLVNGHEMVESAISGWRHELQKLWSSSTYQDTPLEKRHKFGDWRGSKSRMFQREIALYRMPLLPSVGSCNWEAR